MFGRLLSRMAHSAARRVRPIMLAALCGTGVVHAADAPATPASSHDALVAEIAQATAQAASAPYDDARLVLYNRPIITFRTPLVGLSPGERVSRAHFQIEQILGKGGALKATLAPFEGAELLLVDGAPAFPFVAADLAPGQSAQDVLRTMQVALDEAREAHSASFMLRAGGAALVSALLLAAFLWLLAFAGRRLRVMLRRLAETHAQKFAFGGAPLLGSERLFRVLTAFFQVLFWLLALVAITEWLGYALSRFPYTRRWGEQMHASVIELAELIFGAVARSLPGLAVAVAIFVLARAALGLLAPLFSQVERGELTLSWLDKDTVRATRTLVKLGVWLFALAMAYPYLPGAQTEAFKGMSVLLGLMVSIGASNMLGQAISGLIVTYNHTMRVGEYVRVGDMEGTVTEVGTFTTRVRTGMGIELTIPNTLVIGSVTQNYSRAVPGSGYIVDTDVTIGYDAPWRLVHTMLKEAARRTEGISPTPAPVVFQTALSDYYVEYRIVAHALPTQPWPRAELLSRLHAHVQDIFNENGVQIMSPHYMADPEQAKLVAREAWDPPLTGNG